MKRLIVVATIISFLFAIQAMAIKPLHPPIAISYLTFNDGPNGEKIAFSKSNPDAMYQFEHPVLCSYTHDNPNLDNGNIPACHSPTVFMGKGGVVKLWVKGSKEGTLYDRAVEEGTADRLIGHHGIDYYVTETPPGAYYCVYENRDSSLCRLFPNDDPNLKVGDQFVACVSNPIAWGVDKNGVFDDCDKGFKSTTPPPTIYHISRIAKFVVVGISQNGEVLLRCAYRYNAYGIDVSAVALTESGRLDYVQDVFLLVKFKKDMKAEKTKTKKK